MTLHVVTNAERTRILSKVGQGTVFWLPKDTAELTGHLHTLRFPSQRGAVQYAPMVGGVAERLEAHG